MKKPAIAIFLLFLLLTACSPSATTPGPNYTFSTGGQPATSATQITPTDSGIVNLEDLNNWTTIVEDPGLTIKREGENFNYLFVFDPQIVKITVRLIDEKIINEVPGEDAFMSQLLNVKEPEADCGFAGPIYHQADLHAPVIQNFPMIEDGQLTEAENSFFPNSRTLYIDSGKVWISDTTGNSLESAQYAMSGHNPSEYKDVVRGNEEIYYEIAAVKDNQLLIMSTGGHTVDNLVELLIGYGVDPSKIIVINDHPQAGCKTIDYYQWNNVVGSAIFVTEP